MGWDCAGSVVGIALLVAGCTYWEPYPLPAPSIRPPSALRASDHTGALLYLVEPFVSADTLFGRVGRDTVGLPLAQLRGIQRQRLDGLRTLGLIAGVSAVWITVGLYSGGLE
jgi:hypothetical protein